MRGIAVQLAGVVMLLSAFAHGPLGWRTLGPELARAGTPPDLIGAMTVGWWFGSAMMLACGGVTWVAGSRLRRHDRSGVVPVLIVALAWVLFGLAAMVYRSFNPFFLLFVGTGLLAGVPALGRTRVRGTGTDPT
jgi:hypothetical protein